MNILYTGFKGDHNASHKLVSQFCGNKLFLTNSFSGLYSDIEKINVLYDRVYMFGLDKNLKNTVRLEKKAEKEGCLLTSNIDFDEIMEQLSNNGINVTLSENPTHYLCNEAYWHILKKYNGNAVFIHIPSNKNITDEFIARIILAFSKMES